MRGEISLDGQRGVIIRYIVLIGRDIFGLIKFQTKLRPDIGSGILVEVFTKFFASFSWETDMCFMLLAEKKIGLHVRKLVASIHMFIMAVIKLNQG